MTETTAIRPDESSPLKSRIRSFLRYPLLFLLEALGINRLFSFINRERILILWYHGVCDDDFTILRGYDERHIPRSLFRRQLAHLRRRGYRFVTMSTLTRPGHASKGRHKLVALTFDDGFQNVVRNAYPVMREFGARGCFYLVSDLIGKEELLWTDLVETSIRNLKEKEFRFRLEGETITYEMGSPAARERAMKDIKSRLRTLPDRARRAHMKQFALEDAAPDEKEFRLAGWKEIQALDRKILEIGSHTKTHPNCVNLTSRDELEDEILRSRLEIEKRVGYEIRHFCYPAGSYTDSVLEWVKNSGYRSAVTIIPGLNDEETDPLQLKRIGVNENFLLFKAMTSGSYGFLINLLRSFRLSG